MTVQELVEERIDKEIEERAAREIAPALLSGWSVLVGYEPDDGTRYEVLVVPVKYPNTHGEFGLREVNVGCESMQDSRGPNVLSGLGAEDRRLMVAEWALVGTVNLGGELAVLRVSGDLGEYDLHDLADNEWTREVLARLLNRAALIARGAA